MIIEVEVQEIEEYTNTKGDKYHRVIMLEKKGIRQFLQWSVRDEYKRDIQHLKEGSSATVKVKKIASNYDGSLNLTCELVKS